MPTSAFTAPFCKRRHNALILQMGGLIGVGLMVSFGFLEPFIRTFLPQHKQVMDAIAAATQARARTMDHLLTATYGYLERELAGSIERSKLPA